MTRALGDWHSRDWMRGRCVDGMDTGFDRRVRCEKLGCIRRVIGEVTGKNYIIASASRFSMGGPKLDDGYEAGDREFGD